MRPDICSRARRFLVDVSCVGSALLLILGFAGIGDSLAAQANHPCPAEGTLQLERGGAAVLDRITFAVEGLESDHGADPKMWRANPNGPQGPMQVSAAAAEDAGGGDRFDERQNRAIGRAYLALMYRRYGSWPDAVAAYNWGPGNMDSWIGGGRPYEKLPPAVERYRIRVLLGSFPAAPRPGIGLRHLKRTAADPHNGRVAVERLYAEIMRAANLHIH
jgi:hypothetical protein